MLLTNLCSRVLHQMQISDIGLYSLQQRIFLQVRPGHLSSGTLLLAKVIGNEGKYIDEICELYSNSTLALNTSGPGALCRFSLPRRLVSFWGLLS